MPNQEKQYKKTIGENKEYFTIKSEYMNLIRDFRENETDQFIGGLPVQLQKDCLSQLLRGTNYEKLIYGITIKVNGIRHLMFLSSNGTIYFIDRLTNFYYFKRPDESTIKLKGATFLFDGELVFHKKTQRWEFFIFDVLFYEDRGKVHNWMSNNYYDRLHIMDKAVRDLKIVDFDITLKTWFPIETIKNTDNIYKYIVDKTNKERGSKGFLEDDGLILQPFDGMYVPFREWNRFNNIQFKWKPSSQLTVDFKIKFNPENKNEWWLLTKTNQNYDVKQSDGTTVHSIVIPTKSDREKYNENDIVECKLKESMNPQRNIFVILLKRVDKSDGNSLQTIMSTMDAVKNKFSLDMLKPGIQAVVSGTNQEEILKLYSPLKLILCSVDMFFTESEINAIKEVYSGYEKGYELEFRVYPYTKKGSKENINKFMFFYLKDFFSQNVNETSSQSIDIILNKYKKDETIRSTYNDFTLKKPINTVKRVLSKYKAVPTNTVYNNLTFKLALSTETPIDFQVHLKNQINGSIVYNLIRLKKRYSFQFGNSWRVDLTKVVTTYSFHELESGIESYEIECEYIGGIVPFEHFISSMNILYKTILKNTSYC
jgi:hypothetical protein